MQHCSGTELALLFLINKAGCLRKRELNAQVELYPTTVHKGFYGLYKKGLIAINGNQLSSVNHNEECVLLTPTIAELYVHKCITESELRVAYSIMTIEKQGVLITLKKISEFLNMDASSVSKTINSLNSKGLIKKDSNENSSRFSISSSIATQAHI